MLEDFISHIRSKNLLDPQKRYLLAISGGVDSMALGHLLSLGGFQFDLATVNYSLRGEDSKADVGFVKKMANQWAVNFYLKEIDPAFWTEPIQESIQMKARDIRYEWLESIKVEQKYDGILVAHHFEDQLETIWLHLLRGCGIDGVYGMADRRGSIIRPLLPFRKAQLIDFMLGLGMEWREDSSNQKDIYQRNFIRNQILAKIEDSFPAGLEVMASSFGRIKDTGKAFFHLYTQWKQLHVKDEGGFESMAVDAIKMIPGRQSFLFYWLRDYGFSSSLVDDVLYSIDRGHIGKLFHSPTHTLNLDRNQLFLGRKENKSQTASVQPTDVEFWVGNTRYDILRISKDSFIDTSAANAMMDLSHLQFPLEIRAWKTGDRFIPLGMNKEKKISDFLVDLKVPLIQKQDIKVMLSGGTIIWVVGLRISELVKIKDSTSEVLYFKSHNKL